MKIINDYVSPSGVIKTEDVVKAGISKFDYYRFLKNNNFKKIAHGLYMQIGELVDDLAIIQTRCPKAVISHDEALFYYGLIDHEPQHPTFTIYSGYNVQRLKNDGYKAFFVKKELLDIGKTTIIDSFGFSIQIYDLERTICDLVRNRSNFEIQDYSTALKSYARRSDKNLNRLYEYSKIFKVDKILKNYLEVLL